jgi:beta-glucosidase
LWIAEHKGWLWNELPTYFERFVRKVVTALGDLCSLWCTINEPMVYATQGYSFGKWPPGIKSASALNDVTINMLKGHAAAYHAIKELQPHSSVGIAMHIIYMEPHAPVFMNWLAYYLVDRFFNRTFALALNDGIVRLPMRRKVSLPQVKGALDWLGIQYYQHFLVRFNLMSPSSLFLAQAKPTNMQCGPGGWGGLKPEAMYDHIKWFSQTLKKPIYITETGVPDPDDSIRPGYLIRTVRSVWHAVNMGYDVKGFFFWSLLDNFEWAEGRDPLFSFGLHKTNFETQERTARPSASLYGEICRRNGLSLEMVERYAPEVMSKVFPGEAGLNDIQLNARAQA